jgi:hypothetical protein
MNLTKTRQGSEIADHHFLDHFGMIPAMRKVDVVLPPKGIENFCSSDKSLRGMDALLQFDSKISCKER